MDLKVNNVKIPLSTGQHKNFGMIIILTSIDMMSPYQAFKLNLISALEIGKQFKPSLKKKIRWVERAKTKDDLLRLYFNLLLHYERMGLCHGFSCTCSIEKGESNYNPEVKRISKNWIIEERLQQR